MAVEIVPDLWLGSMIDAQNIQFLERARIHTVLDVGSSNRTFHPKIIYRKVDISDSSKSPISAYFDACHSIINQSLLKKEPILVHCAAGVSRSATIIIAWLVRYGGKPLRTALLDTLAKRPIVCPNYGFMKQLECWKF